MLPDGAVTAQTSRDQPDHANPADLDLLHVTNDPEVQHVHPAPSERQMCIKKKKQYIYINKEHDFMLYVTLQ